MVVVDKKYNVAFINNEKGECVEVMKVKVVGSAEYQQMLKESKKYKELIALGEETIMQNRNCEINDIKEKQCLSNYIIAKNYFDNLVDRGLCETNDDFESMFFNFIDKGIALDFSSEHIPPQYLKVLERLGK